MIVTTYKGLKPSQKPIEIPSPHNYEARVDHIARLSGLEAATLFCVSVFRGDVPLMQLILKHHSLADYSCQILDDADFSISSLSGEGGFCRVTVNHEKAIELSDKDGIIDVCELACRSGIKGLVVDDSRTSLLKFSYDTAKYFSGPAPKRSRRLQELKGKLTLPSLVGGVLHNPELVVALAALPASDSNVAIETVLLWATQDVAASAHGVLTAMKPIRLIEYVEKSPGNRSRFFCTSFSEMSRDIELSQLAHAGKQVSCSVSSVKLGVGRGDGIPLKPQDLMGLHCYGSDVVCLGVGAPEGMVLCSANLGDLSRVPLGVIDPDAIAVAQSVINSVSHEWMLLAYDSPLIPEFKCLDNRFEYWPQIGAGLSAFAESDLFDSFVRYGIAEEISGLIDDVAKALWISGGITNNWASMFVTSKYWGMGEVPVTKSLSHSDIKRLASLEYQIPAGSKISISYPALVSTGLWEPSSDVLSVLGMARGPIEVHGLSSDLSVEEVMELAGTNEVLSRDTDAGAILATIASRLPIESLIAASSQDRHWDFLTAVFGAERLLSHLDQLPPRTKVHLVCSDFNL